MLFSSSVFAIALAANAAIPLAHGCISYQQATAYLPDVSIPKMTMPTEPTVKETAPKSDDSSFPYSPPEWSEQLPISLDWLDLLKAPPQMPIQNKELSDASAYDALAFYLHRKAMLAKS